MSAAVFLPTGGRRLVGRPAQVLSQYCASVSDSTFSFTVWRASAGSRGVRSRECFIGIREFCDRTARLPTSNVASGPIP
jgi:hypothetical protein